MEDNNIRLKIALLMQLKVPIKQIVLVDNTAIVS